MLFRLGAMWAGVEPEEGQINMTYVNILKEITEKYAQVGVYVLLDMHQDCLWQAGKSTQRFQIGQPNSKSTHDYRA